MTRKSMSHSIPYLWVEVWEDGGLLKNGCGGEERRGGGGGAAFRERRQGNTN